MAFIQNKIKTVSDLDRILTKDGIKIAERRNEQGILYGLTYVDHITKCVFNGSTLGKPYAASGIEERCGVKEFNSNRKTVTDIDHRQLMNKSQHSSFISGNEVQKIFDSLLQSDSAAEYISKEFKRKKKRRRKGLND